MVIRLCPTQQSNVDIERKILLNLNLQESAQCSTVCTLWDTITRDDQFLRIIAPNVFGVDQKELKKYLNEHAITSTNAIIPKFVSFLNTIKTHETIHFSVKFLCNTDHTFLVKKGVFAPGEIENYDHEKTLALINPAPELAYMVQMAFNNPLEEWFASISFDQTNNLFSAAQDVVLEHEHPNSASIKKAKWAFDRLSISTKECILAGAVISAIGLGVLAYKYFKK